ncbi:hypothetical protein [Terriglobus roseus]|uniref:Lipid-A-disaccharide synthase n=1 Tax=Terriglobus roseus TaxID=392734 RepID=A0A1G7HM38_9BACT|nr:hypothetical protein [Terriglobus roseus]SDF01557.1 hypothetical protein SAMN05444167_1136 [Terriglobus roseus]
MIDPSITSCFLSYEAGAKELREAGESTFDLGLPERNPFSETVVRTAQLLDRLRPSIVIAQEEPAALIAARIFRIPAIFSTHWFPLKEDPYSHHLSYADKILFMEREGLFIEPQEVVGRVTYTGPIVRQVRPTTGGSKAVRRHLGLKATDPLILVLPGSPPEDREPIAQLILDAFDCLPEPQKALVWVSPRDIEKVTASAGPRRNVHVMSKVSNLDDVIIASNLVITKGTYNLTNEIQLLGRPSIALTHRYNPIDDYFVRHSPQGHLVDVRECNLQEFVRLLSASLLQNPVFEATSIPRSAFGGVSRAAAEIYKFLRQTPPQTTPK